MLMSVPQAAEQLDLDAGRVRRLVASGALAGQKVGGRWLVDDAAVAARLQSRHRSGRPLSQRSAWGLLWAAADRPMAWLAPREQSRAIERSRDWPVDDWSWACRHRAEVRRLRAHPSAIARLLDDRRVVRSGASVRGYSVDLIVSDEAEIYVRAADAMAVISEYALVESDRPNVNMRVPPSDLWLFDGADAPWPVAVVDLLDARDDRSARAARGLADRMRKR
jgi:excisionase family DNA binding protein